MARSTDDIQRDIERTRRQLAGTREAGSFGEKREAVYQITAPDGSTLYAGTGGFSLTEFPDAPPPPLRR